MDKKTNEPILELNATEMLHVSGGGFLSWLTGVLQSGSSTSTPANSGELGIRG
jgi:hypothetical protein